MPELPEVETMCRGISPVVGATVVAAARTACTKRPIAIKPRIDRFCRRVAGQKIIEVERLGKRVVVCLRSSDRIIFEPRMTGLVLLGQPPSREHLRFYLQLQGGRVPRLNFWDRRGLGRVSLLSDAEYKRKISDGSVGPDALKIELKEFRDRFRSSRRPIKIALLDQSTVAGVGNLYASEILHLAGIDPRVRCNRLSRHRWQTLFDAMQYILRLAIQFEGSTLTDGTYRNALNDPGSYQSQHRVYDRAGELCPTCQSEIIRRIVQAQRSTFFCRRCQG